MRIDYKKEVILPKDMDKECVELCDLLNRLPSTETFESCMGHYKNTYSILCKIHSSLNFVFTNSIVGLGIFTKIKLS